MQVKTPKTFSEKIIYRKLNTNPKKISPYVDKFKVRAFIEETLGPEHLIPLLKKTTHLTPTDFTTLPSSFVIKTTHGGGGEHVLIVKDKSKINHNYICDRFNSLLNKKLGHAIDEPFYDIEKPSIIIEKLIRHTDGSYPSDYKFHIFNSKNGIKTFIQVDNDRFIRHKRSIFNEDLSKANFSIQPKYPEIEADYIFPHNFEETISIAKKISGALSDSFKYLRIDMYNVDGKTYFGEITFCHGSGWEPIKPKSADRMLGELWDEFE
ncbi:ATP-grasp fold amidoligase family protein [Plesiomonas shigelloides]|uniref:ATP-grasp fold amidoligase family protein n=1 Tax=Plesiomonas shigelloides TaxID=703 RepID=UPI0031B796FE